MSTPRRRYGTPRRLQPEELPSSDTPTLPPLPEGTARNVVIPNDHFVRPKVLPAMPWEKPFQQRKLQSRDPRMVKHCADEAQWEGTLVEGVWADIRQHALAMHDWLMTHEHLYHLMLSWGMKSAHLFTKACYLLDPKEEKSINGLVLCKYLERTLLDPLFQPHLLRHVFEMIDSPKDGVIVKATVQQCELAVPEVPGGTKKRRGGAKKSSLPPTMRRGAGYHHVQALRRLFETNPTANPDEMTFDEFSTAMLQHSNRDFIKACAPQLLEVFVNRSTVAGGAVPLLSLQWLHTTVPVPPGNVMYDADITLLREMEAAGGENAKVTRTKRGKKSSPKR